MKKNNIEIKEVYPTLKRAIARFIRGIQSLSDFRVILRITEEIRWFHPDDTDRQLETINKYFNHLKNNLNHE